MSYKSRAKTQQAPRSSANPASSANHVHSSVIKSHQKSIDGPVPSRSRSNQNNSDGSASGGAGDQSRVPSLSQLPTVFHRSHDDGDVSKDDDDSDVLTFKLMPCAGDDYDDDDDANQGNSNDTIRPAERVDEQVV